MVQKPIGTVRDKMLKASLWLNEGKKGPYISITPAKTYEAKDGTLKDTNSLSAIEALRMSEVLKRAYEKSGAIMQQVRQNEKLNQSSEQQPLLNQGNGQQGGQQFEQPQNAQQLGQQQVAPQQEQIRYSDPSHEHHNQTQAQSRKLSQ